MKKIESRKGRHAEIQRRLDKMNADAEKALDAGAKRIADADNAVQDVIEEVLRRTTEGVDINYIHVEDC
jgi:hypothetical protein